MSKHSQSNTEVTSSANSDAKDQFDRIIAEANVESESLDSEINKLGESAKAFARRHGENKDG